MQRRKENGYTLVEVVLVVAIVAILAAMAYPAYTNFARKARRAEAQEVLMNWANRQMVWRADHATYNAADFNPTNDANFTYTMVTTATSFTLTATAQGDQANDTQGAASCAVLTLDEDGVRGAQNTCWRQAGT
jgi:type IV pilus assembly protein PilE